MPTDKTSADEFGDSLNKPGWMQEGWQKIKKGAASLLGGEESGKAEESPTPSPENEALRRKRQSIE